MNENSLPVALDIIPIENTRPKKVWSFKERLLLPAALIIAVLFDRIIASSLISGRWWSGSFHASEAWAAFWFGYLVIFYIAYWNRIKKDPILWFVAACTIVLCILQFILPNRTNWEYRGITALVIPSVLMAHAQWAANAFTLKNHAGMAFAWLLGWLIKPFTGWGAFFGAFAEVLAHGNKPMVKRVLLGGGVAAVMLAVILPLLMSADQVFSYLISRTFTIGGGSVFTFIFHGIVICLAFAFFYSFLWNVGYGKNEIYTMTIKSTIDKIISVIALGSVISVYVMFCIVQFTFLFARAGLPAGMTYAEYARQGFAQTVVVCALNLLIFGIFLRFGVGDKLMKMLLIGLLVLTGIMLFSGGVRLWLYIDAFGMTWLRLISAWFILYIAAVIALCCTKLLFKKQLPIIALGALLLLIWYVALGLLNPDGFINWYNFQR
ncbi:MAG: DUF4173 domain-containing protein [Defluviitaleaceae bacterium]|nr:DUF4173 domain-containing protein [Defluviitaleaceae bacterium]